MLDGRTDLAVHSAKDMPTEIPAAIWTCSPSRSARTCTTCSWRTRQTEPATLGRSDERRRDRHFQPAAPLPAACAAPGPRAGRHPRATSRRACARSASRALAGTVLAAAGLARLGRAGLAAFRFSFDEMLPAVGQGALAIEGRADDERVRALVAPLNDDASATTVRAERALMSALQGGCQVPIAGYAEAIDGRGSRGAETRGAAVQPNAFDGLRLRAFVGSAGRRRHRAARGRRQRGRPRGARCRARRAAGRRRRPPHPGRRARAL